MDTKGISWVGNIYQKFEAMCLEVEEVMYQDTVKYVENQVQTVGSSVKRFYSDVMQDLLPQSATDTAKGEEINLPLDFYGDVGIYMKPKIGMKEKHTKSNDIKKLKTGDQVKTMNSNSEYAPCQRVSHVNNSKGSLCNKSNLRTRKRLARESLSVNEQSECATCLDEDIKRISSFHEPSNENRLASRQKSNEVSRIDTTEVTTPEETSTDLVEESGNDSEIVSEQIADIPTDDEHGIGKEMDVRAFPGGASLVETNESSNNCKTEVNEMEVIEQAENMKLEESCIVVNKDDFRFVPSCHQGKSKSYQKKICGVFSPRKSSRKHEYEQLAMWPTTVKDSNLKKEECGWNSIPSVAIKDTDEAEWELL